MRTVLDVEAIADLVTAIEAAAGAHAAARPGDRAGRQPIHTVYVPADRVDASTPDDWGREARRLLDAHAPTGTALATAVRLGPDIGDAIRGRVVAKLGREPVEDLRVDFEDGYGTRDDADEDRDAVRAAQAVAAAAGTCPFVGLRVKSFADGGHNRAIRTLDGFVTALLDAHGGTLPDGFVITFPKVVAVEHVALFTALLERLEPALGLADGSLAFEVQVETVESVIDPRGRCTLPALVDAAAGRLRGAHFGVFDYTAAIGLPADEQRLDHPACDFARNVMQVALAGTGVRLSDGSTNRVPRDDTTPAVSAVWSHHARLVRHGLTRGYHQGWDLHPSHLVSRFATVFAFHLAHLDDTTARLAAWSAAEPGSSGVVDEPATVRALLGSLRRAVDCGAVDEQAALADARIDRSTLDRAR